jgi:hypothetical protein
LVLQDNHGICIITAMVMKTSKYQSSQLVRNIERRLD